MNDSIIPVIVGGLIASVPGLIAAIVDLVKHRREEKHDLELRNFDLYASPRFTAIEAYARALTAYIYEARTNEFELEYIRAYEQACLFVSDSTRKLMNAAHGLLVPIPGRPLMPEYREPYTALRSPEYDALLAALHRELMLNSYLEKHPNGKRGENRTKHYLKAISKKIPVGAFIHSFNFHTNKFSNNKADDKTDKPHKESADV